MHSNERILKDLKEEMATIVQALDLALIPYMRSLYERSGTYKISSGMLYSQVDTKKYSKQQIQNWLSKHKKSGVITTLDEKVPNQKAAVYFALTEILDDVTSTKKEATVAEAVNPFDKVNSQLGEILSKLNGLANGYSDLARTNVNPSTVAEAVNGRLADLTKEDSLIYRIREEMTVPTTVANQDDYKQGIREGIRMAVEMGIVLKGD